LVDCGLIRKKIAPNVENTGKISWYKFPMGGSPQLGDMGSPQRDLSIIPSETGEISDKPRGGFTRAGTLASNKINIIKTKKDNVSPGGETVRSSGGRRRSTPGMGGKIVKLEPPKSRRSRDPSQEEINLAREVFRQIRRNFPFHYPNRLWCDIKEDWSLLVRRAVKKYNFDLIKSAFMWALTSEDRQAKDFWRLNFKSLGGLFKKWRDESVALDNLISQYLSFIEREKEKVIKNSPIEDQIENLVRDTVIPQLKKENWERDHIEEYIGDTMDGMRVVMNRLDKISNSLSPKNQFAWHRTGTMLSVVPWFLELDDELVPIRKFWPFEKFIEEYLDHLESMMQRGFPRTIYPKLFSWDNDIFIKFLGQLYEDEGPITKKQQREELPWA
jgi:hypothetical protein